MDEHSVECGRPRRVVLGKLTPEVLHTRMHLPELHSHEASTEQSHHHLQPWWCKEVGRSPTWWQQGQQKGRDSHEQKQTDPRNCPPPPWWPSPGHGSCFQGTSRLKIERSRFPSSKLQTKLDSCAGCPVPTLIAVKRGAQLRPGRTTIFLILYRE